MAPAHHRLVALALAMLQLAVTGRARPLFGERPHWPGGVVAALYLLGAGLSTAALIATVTAVYATTNLIRVILYWKIGFLTPLVLVTDVLALPVVLLGAWLGYRLNRVLPRRAFELTILAIAIAGA